MIYCHDTHVYFTSLTGASKIAINDYKKGIYSFYTSSVVMDTDDEQK